MSGSYRLTDKKGHKLHHPPAKERRGQITYNPAFLDTALVCNAVLSLYNLRKHLVVMAVRKASAGMYDPSHYYPTTHLYTRLLSIVLCDLDHRDGAGNSVRSRLVTLAHV